MNWHKLGCIGLQLGLYQECKQISLTIMTIDDYKDLILEDEINIGYDVEEDDLPDQYDDESYIDGLLTTGFHRVDASEMFGEEVVGYSLY